MWASARAPSSEPISTRESHPRWALTSTWWWRPTCSSTWPSPPPCSAQIRAVLAKDGVALICVPNVAHWYPRLRSATGRFDYDQRGILDSTHLRFFTRRSIRKLIDREGFEIRRVEPVGLPLDALGLSESAGRLVRLVDQTSVAAWPTMFGYQFIIEASPERA